jgi:hypothetical protein
MKFGIVTENKIYAKNTVYKANVSTFEITWNNKKANSSKTRLVIPKYKQWNATNKQKEEDEGSLLRVLEMVKVGHGMEQSHRVPIITRKAQLNIYKNLNPYCTL